MKDAAVSAYEGQMLVDASLLHSLWCYGTLHTVEGVVYSFGSHKKCLEAIDELFVDRAEAFSTDPTDIVTRLRDSRYGAVPAQRAAAADEIEKLRLQLVTKTNILNRYRRALVSIAANTCCDRCQEAALVAQSALTDDQSPASDTCLRNGSKLRP